MKSLPIALVVVAAATGFSTIRAHADTIFSQTGAAEGQYPATVTEYWGQGFTVGGSDMALTTVDMLLGIQGAGNPGNAFFVDLYSDASGQPGTLLETLSGPNNPGSGTFTYSSTGTVLSANTSYWIVDRISNGDGFEYWNEESNTSPEVGTSIGAKFSSNSGASWSLQPSHSMQMVVNGTVVPEPSSFLLMLLGGSAALLMKRRRR